jgi:hypothetical protein
LGIGSRFEGSGPRVQGFRVCRSKTCLYPGVNAAIACHVRGVLGVLHVAEHVGGMLRHASIDSDSAQPRVGNGVDTRLRVKG